jgi:LacI family transcriptional regulator
VILSETVFGTRVAKDDMTVNDDGARRVVTLTDVAARAGVSIATASKALNGRSDVKSTTRERVISAAEELQFSPNPFARALLTSQTGTIGMLTSDLDNRFVLPILLGAEDAFGAGARSVLLADTRDDVIREQHHLRVLKTKRVDGILVVGRSTNARPPIETDDSLPVVYVYAPCEDPANASFTPDNVSAGRIAVEHLLGRGRRKIAFLNGDMTYAAARERVFGAQAAMMEAGLELVGGANMYGQWSESWGRSGAMALLSGRSKVDAIIAGNDVLARGVLDAARSIGLRIPADVAVIGFDNWDILCQDSWPPLTSVDMNLQELGRRAAAALVEAIGGKRSFGVHLGPVRVVPRDSTAIVDLSERKPSAKAFGDEAKAISFEQGT